MAVEADPPSSSNAPSNGLESQPKMETETVPSSSGTFKNYLFKLGIPFELDIEMHFSLRLICFQILCHFFDVLDFLLVPLCHSINMNHTGDRVRYIGSALGGLYPASSPSR